MKVCLDLFCGLGGFSAAFADAPDWHVVTVDVDPQFDPDYQRDVLDLRPADVLAMLPVDDWHEMDTFVVLASPPCTEFSPAQNLNGEFEPDAEHVLLAHNALGLCRGLPTDYWILENPRGRLRSYFGQPKTAVTYCQYGERRMKPTDLWGEHPDSFIGRRCGYGDDCHINHRDGSNPTRDKIEKDTAAKRAKVPYRLSKAIREAVENPTADESIERWLA